MQHSLVQHICYSSPDWGHPLNKRSPRRAYEAFLEFLKKCTDCSNVHPAGRIEVLPAGPFMPDGWSDSAACSELRDRFGDSTTKLYIGTSAIPGWSVPKDLHEWAVDFALGQPSAKRDHPDPVTFTTSFQFLLRDPRTGVVLPGQELPVIDRLTVSSNALLFVASGKVSATVELRFPYTEPNADFLELFGFIRPYLPFRLSRSRFRLWIPKRDQSGYRRKVVDPILFAQC